MPTVGRTIGRKWPPGRHGSLECKKSPWCHGHPARAKVVAQHWRHASGTCRSGACAIFVLLLLLPSRGVSAADLLTAAMRDDAELSDVTFVDAEHGWAVGDRGAIWHTLDGGRHWEPQESGVTCRLNTVQFVDAEHGWAGGGALEPYTHVSRGVLLVTRDGGRTWIVSPQSLFGAVLRLKFFDARRGWVLTQPTAMVPSGVMSTDNGGQDWTPLPPSEVAAWSCGDFADPQRGVLASDTTIAAIERDALHLESRASAAWRRSVALALGPGGLGVLVGDGGLVLKAEGVAGHWRPAGGLPPAAALFDFQAVAIRQSHIWIAGSPGSRILHSADGGKTWELLSTGATLPIEALWFADELHGWGVGALGQILSTSDGGRTWRFQRGAGRRVAYLAVFSEVDDVPLELLGRLSAGEGYFGAVLVLNRRDLEGASEEPLLARIAQQQALLSTGAGHVSMCWQFPLRQRGINLSARQTIDLWRGFGDGDPVARLEDVVVRAVRCWRPEIVVTHDAGHRGDEWLREILGRAVLRGVARAAEQGPAKAAAGHPPNADPPAAAGGSVSEAGLPPWKVRRVVSTLRSGQLGQMTVSGAQLLPQLGRSLADYVAPARGVLPDSDVPPPASISLQVAWDESGQTGGYRDVFSGLIVPAGGEERRAALGDPGSTVQQLRRIADRRLVLQGIVAHSSMRSLSRANWLSQLGTLTNDLDEPSAAMLLYQLGCRYRATGQWELAADTFAQLADRYPRQQQSAAAALWLLQYYASAETAYRASREGRIPASALPAAAEDPHDGSLPWQRHAAEPIATSGGTADAVIDARRRLAAQWAERLEEMSPQLATEPWGTFPRIRALGPAAPPGKVERLLLGMVRSRCHDAWWSCAAGERWLADPRAAEGVPKPVWRCRRATEKPTLDGRLDDPCWRAAPGGDTAAVELHSALGDDAAWPAVAQLAYDDEYLYVAVTCRQAPGVNYASPKEPRVRDADLTDHDRIELALDIDRDWVSYWRLAIDHRGLTADDCWGDATWNPTWYVATSTDKDTWTCEAAIPWSELAPRPPRAHDVWAVGMTRIVPGVGCQSWGTSAMAAKVQGERFGYLIFD